MSETIQAPIPGVWEQAKQWSGSGRAAVAIRGGAWTIAGYAATQLLRTAATLILARYLLGPETFGIVGLVGVFLGGLSMFSELGILANVVQHPRGDEPTFLNTAFSIQAGRGFAIWIVSLLAAYPLALFYHEPQLLPLLTVAGLSEMLRGLTSTAAWTLTRDVKLRNVTLLAIISELIATTVCILWAVISPSAWALVARTVASAAFYAAGSHFIATPKISFGWDQTAARDILHFGGWISIATATYFLSGQGERLILGKFVTPAELGCFSLAVMISSVPAAGITQLVNQIFLPLISRSVRSSRADAVHDFLRSRRMFFAGALFTAIGFLACGKPVVGLVLTPKYMMTGWILQALGVRVALDIFAAPASTVILAYGRSKYSAVASMSRLIMMIAGIWYSFLYLGFHAAVLSLIIAQALSYFPMIAGLSRLLPDVAGAELRWYLLFLFLIGLAAFAPWPGALYAK